MQNSLRPKSFESFIGQAKLKEVLKVMIDSSIKRKTSVDHILLYGSPGSGKTSLATIIANELNVNIRYAQGPMIEKKADLLSLFASIKKNEIIFIDEIHSMNRGIEELIYSALEDGKIDLIIGVEGDSKVVRMNLPPFTLIAATTKPSKLSIPLKDRFGLIAKLSAYTEDDIKIIIKNSALNLKTKINNKSLKLIAENSSFIPRIANMILKRCMDFQIDLDKKLIDEEVVIKTFQYIGLYKDGLNDSHIFYLKTLMESFKNRWVSLESLCGFILEDRNHIEKEIEPLLLSKNFILKSSRGRKISDVGIKYLATFNIAL